ncbi:hypothetical protein SLEP1_g2360 [Rubroshorea leprosula]|uniref:Uncharacterized protein n=1 Tax=Rubroshorea leprosula TaxID=152421 RepID=A0AAV5HMR1_9ROSI|nr:hypothetical protein SLEP1_g2360 [Rubroshorea leprosula]
MGGIFSSQRGRKFLLDYMPSQGDSGSIELLIICFLVNVNDVILYQREL